MIPKSFDAVCEEIGYDRTEACPIQAKSVYYAYKNGEAHLFYSRTEAEAVSKMVERVDVNKEEREAWYASRAIIEQKAFQIWFDALTDHWLSTSKNLSKDLFELCYAEAYQRGHSAGYDEVANYLYDVVEFALRVKECN